MNEDILHEAESFLVWSQMDRGGFASYILDEMKTMEIGDIKLTISDYFTRDELTVLYDDCSERIEEWEGIKFWTPEMEIRKRTYIVWFAIGCIVGYLNHIVEEQEGGKQCQAM